MMQKMVPREPTEEMMQAVYEWFNNRKSNISASEAFRQRWMVMWDAAPAPASPEPRAEPAHSDADSNPGCLWTTRRYPCGCKAEGPGDVPAYCPNHGEVPRAEPADDLVARLEALSRNDLMRRYPLANDVVDEAAAALRQSLAERDKYRDLMNRYARECSMQTDRLEQEMELREASEAREAELRAAHDRYKRRLDAMFPLFEEARDALTAISLPAAKLHNVDLSLGDRMDEVGIGSRWDARCAREDVARAAESTPDKGEA